MFSPRLRGFSLGSLVSSHIPKAYLRSVSMSALSYLTECGEGGVSPVMEGLPVQGVFCLVP